MTLARAAYGLRVFGTALDCLLTHDPPSDLRPLEVVLKLVERPSQETFHDDHHLKVPVRGWHLELDRAARRMVVELDGPVDPDRVAHPVLGIAAAMFARWDERTAFHAGAFAFADRAWLVLGHRARGKSSTLAALSRAGHSILADDVVVVAGGRAFSGPRFVDLRPGVAPTLGLEDRVRPARDGEVERYALPPGCAALPVAGWVCLDWAATSQAVPLNPAERIAALHEHLSVGLVPLDSGALMDLARLPAWRLARPWNDVDRLDGVVDDLLGTVSTAV